MEIPQLPPVLETSLNLEDFHSRMSLLSQEIMNGKLSTPTVIGVSYQLHNCVGHMRSLTETVSEMENVFTVLEQNRGNYEFVLQQFQCSSWRSYFPDPIIDNIQLTNEVEFDNLLSQLRGHAKSIQNQIDALQSWINWAGIALIIINCVLAYNNLTRFMDDKAQVAEYQNELLHILQRIQKAAEWFQGSNKGEKEQRHLQVQIMQIYARFIEIRSALQCMRKEAVHRGFYSLLIGGASLTAALVLPFSLPWIFYAAAAGSAANMVTGAMQFKIVGDIEKLVGTIQQIETDYKALLALSSQANGLPDF